VIAVGVEGTILRSSDSGESWRHTFSGTLNDLSDVAFSNGEQGVAVGYAGTIVSTTDGGISWSPIQHPFNVDFTSVAVADANVAVATASNGTIIRTDDGGLSWHLVMDSSSISLFSTSFADSTDGFIAGNNGIILRSSDGGAHWSTRERSLAESKQKPQVQTAQIPESEKRPVESPTLPRTVLSGTGKSGQPDSPLKNAKMSLAPWKPFDGSTVLLQIPGAFGGALVMGGAGALLGSALDPSHGGVSVGSVLLGTAGVFFGIPTGVYLVGNWKGGNGGYSSTLLWMPGLFLGGLLVYAAVPPLGGFIMAVSPIVGPILGYHLSASSVNQENNSTILPMNQNNLASIPGLGTTIDLRVNVITIYF
jgi:photosystem II stability/assembly factor-like uncharacterized protein